MTRRNARADGRWPAVVLMLFGAACAQTDSSRGVPDLAGRTRPLAAPDVPAEPALEAAPPPATWVHHHYIEIPYAENRADGEPMAPDGTQRVALVPVPGCRCNETALRVEFSDEPPGDGPLALDELPALQTPEVVTQRIHDTVWVWLRDATPGRAYTLHLSVDPAGALLSDPVAVIAYDEYARFAVTPEAVVSARLIRGTDIRYPEIPIERRVSATTPAGSSIR